MIATSGRFRPKSRLSRRTQLAWRSPIGLISTTWPAMSSTRSSSCRMPSSPSRWYASTVNGPLRSGAAMRTIWARRKGRVNWGETSPFGDLDDEQDVRGSRVPLPVAVGAVPQDGEVGLGFLVLAQDYGILDTHGGLSAGQGCEQRVETVHAAAVGRPDGRHLEHLAVDELHPVVLVEDSGLSHTVVFVDREAVSGERHGHTIGPPRRVRQVADMAHDGAGAGRERHPTDARRTAPAPLSS